MRRTLRVRLLLPLALLLVAAPLAAYTIVLKDGSTLQAREKFQVQGSLAMITLPSGAKTTLPMVQIDVAATDARNASDYGSATVVAGPAPAPTPAAQAAPPSLAQLAAQRRVVPEPARPLVPTAAPSLAAAPEPPKGTLPRTPAGYVDFLRSPRTQVSQVELATTVGELLRSHGVSNVGIFEGSQPRRLLLEITANSEGGVFQAIGAAAQALLEVESKQPGAVDALELFLATDHRQRAGQFLINRERAQELVSRQLDLTAFYLKYVEF